MVLDHPGPMAVLGNPRCKRFALYVEVGAYESIQMYSSAFGPTRRAMERRATGRWDAMPGRASPLWLMVVPASAEHRSSSETRAFASELSARASPRRRPVHSLDRSTGRTRACAPPGGVAASIHHVTARTELPGARGARERVGGRPGGRRRPVGIVRREHARDHRRDPRRRRRPRPRSVDSRRIALSTIRSTPPSRRRADAEPIRPIRRGRRPVRPPGGGGGAAMTTAAVTAGGL